MGNETIPSTRADETIGKQVGELPYDGVHHADLIDRFYETEGDPDIGRALSVRIFEHADFLGDPRTTPLVGRDGAQVQDDDTPLTLADYVNFAAKHHFDAVAGILDFLMMEKRSPSHDAMSAAILDRLSASKSHV